ncbi:MAG: reverse transcriptase domain-containing protein, partial [Aeromonas sp.]|uniref:reverse transcriptase domain-containing protein n=1 Tax=Aeromonas sp. TaxID=647 RepID=UPI003F35F54D
NITEETVATAATKLSGACGPSGTDGYTLKTWLLYHRKSSTALRDAFARFANWQANNNVPWAAIRALLSNRGLALDKFPGVRPIGIGNIERRLIAKCILAEAGPAATEAAGTTQLAVGLPAGIEGAIHAARHMWDTQSSHEQFGFLQIDAKNAFNELDRTMMLYVVRYLWPQGARYAFNCYKHWSPVLYLDPCNGTATTVLSATGVVQGCPASMILYSLTLVPLIKRLQLEFPKLLHLWYSDDGNAAGLFPDLKIFLTRLTTLGKPYGYHVQPTKCQLITRHLDKANTAFPSTRHGSVIITSGNRFLGGHIGSDTHFTSWLTAKIQTWATAIASLSTAAPRFPQSAYTGLQKSLQQEWQHVQRTCPCPPHLFAPLEHAIADTFIPALFQLPVFHPSLPPRHITALPIKRAGLALPNPIHEAPSCHTASKDITFEISRSLVAPTGCQPHLTRPTNPTVSETGPFRIAAHRDNLATGRILAHHAKDTAHQTIFDNHLATLPPPLQLRLQRCCHTGSWLSARPGLLERTVLSAQEWRDGLYIRFGITPSHIPATCDGCNCPNDINHALNCLHGGLVHLRHNEIRQELAAIACEVFEASAITIEPSLALTAAPSVPLGQPIYVDPLPAPPHPTDPPATTPAPTPATHDRGDIAIRGLFERGTNAIIDVRITNLDSLTSRTRDAATILQRHETEKRRRYQDICASRRESFHPFVASTDGMLAPEATRILQHLAEIMARKQQRPYSAIMKHLRLRLAITLVKAVHHCLRGSRKKRHLAPNTPFIPLSPLEPSPDFRMLHG